MAENTKIEWTDHTFNPWEGCQKVGPGCDNCYAETRNARYAGGQAINWGPGAPRRRTSAANWRKPLAWNANHETFFAVHGRRQRVFCASLADWADNAVPLEWLVDLLELVRTTPHLDWLMLTKRIGIVLQRLQEAHSWILEHWPAVDAQPLSQWLTDWTEEDNPPTNVWLGATIVNQEEADRDIPKLLAMPARVRFLSMEPLLGPVSFEGMFANPGNSADGTNALEALDWVIVGGESGPGARPMHPNWPSSLRDQCQAAGTPFLFKQWGEWIPRSSCYHQFSDGKSCADLDPGCKRWPCVRLTVAGHNGRDLAQASNGDDAYMQQVGKAMSGRLLDGRTWDECPSA